MVSGFLSTCIHCAWRAVISVRSRTGWRGGLPPVGEVDAELLLLTLARVDCELYFLSLLATVRGGTSFLGPSATKKRSKENAFPQSVLSVPSVQTAAFGSRVERCSLERRALEPLLLANSYIPTLRHQCSRARLTAGIPIRPHASLRVGELRHPRDDLGEGALARNTFGHRHTRKIVERLWAARE
jgi:hypothetical protein